MNEKQKRNIHFSFKATPEEDAIIRQKMQSAGIRNQSAFIRKMTLNGYLLKLDLPELHQAVRLIGTLSNNVNQIARRMNEHGSIYETELEDIADQQKEIREMMKQI
ncbi:MAG: plasmid mobilization relaxosome protein MobC, partial [Eubacterium sp.]|nr:plasmid mobilization relaxosome protein MobC [Eubacterium sp.]